MIVRHDMPLVSHSGCVTSRLRGAAVERITSIADARRFPRHVTFVFNWISGLRTAGIPQCWLIRHQQPYPFHSLKWKEKKTSQVRVWLEHEEFVYRTNIYYIILCNGCNRNTNMSGNFNCLIVTAQEIHRTVCHQAAVW